MGGSAESVGDWAWEPILQDPRRIDRWNWERRGWLLRRNWRIRCCTGGCRTGSRCWPWLFDFFAGREDESAQRRSRGGRGCGDYREGRFRHEE